jgi:membrane fusion protein
MNDLFRPQAVSHQTRRVSGEVVLATPLPTALLGGLLVFVLGAAVLFAGFASYAREEQVPGWIVPDAGLIRVTARQGGIVETLSAVEGGAVAGVMALGSAGFALLPVS